MARRIGSRPQRSVSRSGGLRGELVDALRARAAKLATVEIYDFTAQRLQLAERIAALEAGVAVQLQTWELPDDALAAVGARSRFDPTAPRLFRLVGNRLIVDEPGTAAD